MVSLLDGGFEASVSSPDHNFYLTEGGSITSSLLCLSNAVFGVEPAFGMREVESGLDFDNTFSGFQTGDDASPLNKVAYEASFATMVKSYLQRRNANVSLLSEKLGSGLTEEAFRNFAMLSEHRISDFVMAQKLSHLETMVKELGRIDVYKAIAALDDVVGRQIAEVNII